MKLSEAIKALSSAQIEDARFDARALFSHFGGYTPAQMIGVDVECESAELEEAIERRASREPLQYILGYTDFYNERYLVNGSCLIPRQDTEILVDYAVKNIPEGEAFLDLCTGSGCVGISTLKNTVGTSAVLVDISEQALEVAKENAVRIGVLDRARHEQLDVTVAIPDGEWYAILSNPPYVKAAVYEELEREIFHEPRIAFVGGEDGLDIYRRMLPLCRSRLKADGFVALEIGFDQGEDLKKIAAELGFGCEILKDLSSNDRVAVLRLK